MAKKRVRAKLTPAELQAARSRAGKKSHSTGKGHEWNSRSASKAGKKGAEARAKKKAARQTLPIDAPQPDVETANADNSEHDIHGD